MDNLKSQKTNSLFIIAAVAWSAIVIVFAFRNFATGALTGDDISSAVSLSKSTLASFSFAKLFLHISDLIKAAIFFFCVGGAGDVVLHLLKAIPADKKERFLFSTGIGTGIYATVAMLLGWAGLFNAAVLNTLVLVFGLAKLILLFRKNAAHGDAAIEPDLNIPRTKIELLLLVPVVLALFITWVVASVPMFDPDSMMYHLAIPKHYLEAGRVYYIPFIFHANWPLSSEMVYSWGMVAGGTGVARMLAYCFGLLACGAVWAIGRRVAGAPGGLWSLAIFAMSPLVWKQSTITSSEMAIVFYVVAALLAFLEWERTESSGWLVVCSLLAGMCMSCKLLGGVPVTIIGLLVLVKSKQGRIKNIFIFGTGAALFVLPWLIKSFVWTGNPIWPFMYGVFGGANWNELAARDYVFFAQSGYRIAEVGEFFRVFPRVIYTIFDQSAGIVVAAAAPFLFFRLKDRKILLTVVLALLFAGWFFISQQTRFMIPALAIFTVTAGWGIASFSEGFRKLAVVAALAISSITLIQGWTFFSYEYGVALGGEKPESFLMRSPTYSIAAAANEILPEDAVVLLQWTSAGYYFDRPYLWGDPMDQGVFDYCSYKDSEEFSAELKKRGVTHVVFNMFGFQQKVELDKKIREANGLKDTDPTVIKCAVMIQNRLMNEGSWQRVHSTSNNHYHIFRIIE